ncbi:MAG: FMN-binding protein [Actinomycetia bacterium]|nr:FMN-binding protein [Actinomycetes bacterium]
MTTPPTNPPTTPPTTTTPAPRPRPTRRKPARGAKAIALLSSVAATGGIGAALAHAEGSGLTSVVTQVASASTAAPATTTTPSTSSSTASAGDPTTTTSTSAAATATSGAYVDGTWTGGVATMRYGPMQVQVTISGAKVTAVTVLQEPGDGKSQRINAQAVPILESQAVAAQSANLDGVSGATYTTVSYEASLQSALDAAAR